MAGMFEIFLIMVTFVDLSKRQLGGVVKYRHWPAPSARSSRVLFMLSSACLHWLSCFDEDSSNEAPPQQGTSAILVLLCNMPRVQWPCV